MHMLLLPRSPQSLRHYSATGSMRPAGFLGVDSPGTSSTAPPKGASLWQHWSRTFGSD